LRFKIDWASLIVGSKFTVFALFYFVFGGNFPSTVQAPRRLIFGGAILRRVFCVTGLGGLRLEGLIHGGAYFRNFTVSLTRSWRIWKNFTPGKHTYFKQYLESCR